jgi:hypothetical protein
MVWLCTYSRILYISDRHPVTLSRVVIHSTPLQSGITAALSAAVAKKVLAKACPVLTPSLDRGKLLCAVVARSSQPLALLGSVKADRTS